VRCLSEAVSCREGFENYLDESFINYWNQWHFPSKSRTIQKKPLRLTVMKPPVHLSSQHSVFDVHKLTSMPRLMRNYCSLSQWIPQR
jgi:hypothetical protein